jgi:chromate transporter
VIRVGRRALRNRLMLVIAGLAFIGIFAFGIPFPIIIAGAALIGWIGAATRPELFQAQPHGGKGASGDLVDDLAPATPHDGLGFGRAMRIIGICGVLWIAPVLALGLMLGWNTVFTPIAVFFSKMAVVTFGGAYAVLAYVAQQAVETHQWLKPGEMLDGLALAETTPGPLILVLVYVGFLAAFRDPGTLPPLAAGMIGATLTTWVTFVPCFLWIFLGAPYVEKLSGNRIVSGALTAVTAAVVGVILNLAIWFGLHTLFGKVGQIQAGPMDMPWPVWSSLDPAAAVLSLIALVAVFRFRIGLIPTLALCGGLGLLWQILRWV